MRLFLEFTVLLSQLIVFCVNQYSTTCRFPKSNQIRNVLYFKIISLQAFMFLIFAIPEGSQYWIICFTGNLGELVVSIFIYSIFILAICRHHIEHEQAQNSKGKETAARPSRFPIGRSLAVWTKKLRLQKMPGNFKTARTGVQAKNRSERYCYLERLWLNKRCTDQKRCFEPDRQLHSRSIRC